MDKKLSRLADLAELICDRELTKLAALSKRRRELEASVSASLDARARTLAAAAPDPAHFAGADATWLLWNTRHLQALSEASAQAAATAEEQLVVARRAYGRTVALSRLARK